MDRYIDRQIDSKTVRFSFDKESDYTMKVSFDKQIHYRMIFRQIDRLMKRLMDIG